MKVDIVSLSCYCIVAIHNCSSYQNLALYSFKSTICMHMYIVNIISLAHGYTHNYKYKAATYI